MAAQARKKPQLENAFLQGSLVAGGRTHNSTPQPPRTSNTVVSAGMSP